MEEPVAHPVVVQLLPKSRRPFRDAFDFVRSSVAVRVFALGSTPGEVTSNASMALAKAIGKRRWSRCHKVATCLFTTSAQWPKSYLVEDWSYQHGKAWVKRYWAHAPSAEIAAWAARAEIAAAAGRERNSPQLMAFRDPMAPNARLGWKTTVHEFTDCRGLVCPHYEPHHAMDGYRAAMMVAISRAESKGKRVVDHLVDQALADSARDEDLLYSRVSYAPARRSLRRSGAAAYGIAREIALEQICDEFAQEMKRDAKSLDKYANFFASMHGWLITPIGSNLIDIGPAETANSDDLRACLKSETLAAEIEHESAPILEDGDDGDDDGEFLAADDGNEDSSALWGDDCDGWSGGEDSDSDGDSDCEPDGDWRE